jgi:hypothetical protein
MGVLFGGIITLGDRNGESRRYIYGHYNKNKRETHHNWKKEIYDPNRSNLNRTSVV